MRRHDYMKKSLLLIPFIFFFFSAVHLEEKESANIIIDAASPLKIVWPFEVAMVGESGERGLRIGPKIGRGWRNEAGGQAFYRFYLPADGNYVFWIFSLWHDVCANAIFAKVDSLDRIILGNDPLLNQWHWVRGPELFLKKGTHTLELSNHSDNIALQRIFLTNSPLVVPENAKNVFADLFYDGFDGCDRGNFSAWTQVSGQWTVQNPWDPRKTNQNVLIGKSTDHAMILLKNNRWTNYALSLAIQSLPPKSQAAAIGICFNLDDSRNHHRLEISPTQNQQTAQLALIRQIDQHSTILFQHIIPWTHQKWHLIDLTMENRQLKIKIDDKSPIAWPFDSPLQNSIGLHLKGPITAYFDNIHIRQPNNTSHLLHAQPVPASPSNCILAPQ